MVLLKLFSKHQQALPLLFMTLSTLVRNVHSSREYTVDRPFRYQNKPQVQSLQQLAVHASVV